MAAIPPTIAAIGAIVVSVIGAIRADTAVKEGHDRADQNQAIAGKVDEVKDMVNGGLSSAKAEIAGLKATVLDLRAQLAAERGTGNK